MFVLQAIPLLNRPSVQSKTLGWIMGLDSKKTNKENKQDTLK